nr:hypothetical protein [Tanacetum cinerariifolium]
RAAHHHIGTAEDALDGRVDAPIYQRIELVRANIGDFNADARAPLRAVGEGFEELAG